MHLPAAGDRKDTPLPQNIEKVLKDHPAFSDAVGGNDVMHVAMSRIQIIGVQRRLDAVLTAMQELGAVQLSDATGEASVLRRMPRDDDVEDERETLSYLLVRLDSLLAALSIEAVPTGPPSIPRRLRVGFGPMIADIRADLDQLGSQVQSLTDRREQLADELQSLPRYEATIRRLIPLAVEIPHLDHFETVALLIDRHFEHLLPRINDELGQLTDRQIEIVSGLIDDQTLGALLVFPRDHMTAVLDFLGHEQINQLRLPEELTGVPLRQTLSALLARKEQIPLDIAGIDDQLAALAGHWQDKLCQWRLLLHDRVVLLQARNLAGATQSTFVICGWIPRQAILELKQMLQERVGEEVVVCESAISEEMADDTPVMLQNPAAVRPFETLVGLLSLPRYASWDPSLLMAIFVPLFFGMILGDIAYGLVVMGLGLWLRRRFTGTVRDLGQVLLWGGGWAVVFGWFYGEFLGTLGQEFGLVPMLDRAEALVPLFITAVAVGIAQVTLGLVLGAWAAFRQRHLGPFSEKIGALVSLMGLYAVVAVVAELLPAQFFTPAVITVLLGLILLSAPMGLIGLLLGPLELLGTVGNILSYLRIAAIGLSSVYLADVANQMVGLTGNIFLGFLVAVFFHILNIALGIVSSTIQSLRLHYVEFFGKFFEGGGKPFRPFKRDGFAGWQG